MSLDLITAAFKTKTGSSSRKLILIMMADRADDSELCDVSYQQLADMCEMSRRSVIDHVAALQEAGLLTILQRDSNSTWLRPNFYRLTLSTPTQPTCLCHSRSATKGAGQ